jgi:hypothetical protein
VVSATVSVAAIPCAHRSPGSQRLRPDYCTCEFGADFTRTGQGTEWDPLHSGMVFGGGLCAGAGRPAVKSFALPQRSSRVPVRSPRPPLLHWNGPAGRRNATQSGGMTFASKCCCRICPTLVAHSSSARANWQRWLLHAQVLAIGVDPNAWTQLEAALEKSGTADPVRPVALCNPDEQLSYCIIRDVSPARTSSRPPASGSSRRTRGAVVGTSLRGLLVRLWRSSSRRSNCRR